MDLQGLLAAAEQHAPSLELARADLAAAAERAAQVTEWPDPKLRVTWWAEEVQTRSGPMDARVAASQRIPWPGKLDAAGSSAEAHGESAAAGVQLARIEIRLAASRSWNERIRIEREKTIVANQVELLGEVERVVRGVAERENSRPAGLMRVQIDLGRLTDRLAALGESAVRVEAELGAMTGVELGDGLPWNDGRFSDDYGPDTAATGEAETMPERNLEEHPMLRLLAFRARAAQHDIDVARLATRPDFEVAADYTFVGDAGAPGVTSGRDPISLTFGIDLSFPTAGDHARQLEARARHGARLAQLRGARLSLESRLESAVSAHRDASRRLALYRDELLPEAQEAFANSNAGFQAGSAPFVDVIETTRDLLSLRLEALRAESNRADAQAELDYLTAFGSLHVTER